MNHNSCSIIEDIARPIHKFFGALNFDNKKKTHINENDDIIIRVKPKKRFVLE